MPIQRAAALARPARRRAARGGRRAGRNPHGHTLRQKFAFIRESAVTLGGTLVVALAALLASSQFLPSQPARGLIVGVGLVGVIGAMWIWVGQVGRTPPNELNDLGRQWTAHELRKLHRHGWVVMNNVRLQMRDIDHLLIGRAGVVAVETRWVTTAWTFDPIDQSVFDAARRAHAHARELRGWQDLEALGVEHIGSAVFVWGPGVHEVPSGAAIETTAVVTRRTAGWWRRGLAAERLSPTQVSAVWRTVDAQRRTRDPREAQSAHLPAAPGEWLTRVVFAVVAACAGVLAISSVLTTGSQRALSMAWWLLLGVGVAAWRLGGVRQVGAAGRVGVGAAILIAAATLLTLSA